MVSGATLLALLTAAVCYSADRPGLFFREDFRESPAATPATQEHIANADVLLGLYGPARQSIKKSHHDQPADDPYYIWSGDAQANWAVGLRHRKSNVDLSGQAKIRWRSKQSGFRNLRIILKLDGGNWLVSDAASGPSSDWCESEFVVADIHWRRLNIDDVVEGNWVDQPDLHNVEEIGFTDLMRGGGTPASSRLDWIEVYGRPVKR